MRTTNRVHTRLRQDPASIIRVSNGTVPISDRTDWHTQCRIQGVQASRTADVETETRESVNALANGVLAPGAPRGLTTSADRGTRRIPVSVSQHSAHLCLSSELRSAVRVRTEVAGCSHLRGWRPPKSGASRSGAQVRCRRAWSSTHSRPAPGVAVSPPGPGRADRRGGCHAGWATGRWRCGPRWEALSRGYVRLTRRIGYLRTCAASAPAIDGCRGSS